MNRPLSEGFTVLCFFYFQVLFRQWLRRCAQASREQAGLLAWFPEIPILVLMLHGQGTQGSRVRARCSLAPPPGAPQARRRSPCVFSGSVAVDDLRVR